MSPLLRDLPAYFRSDLHRVRNTSTEKENSYFSLFLPFLPFFRSLLSQVVHQKASKATSGKKLFNKKKKARIITQTHIKHIAD
jgi:hypothetical protein